MNLPIHFQIPASLIPLNPSVTVSECGHTPSEDRHRHGTKTTNSACTTELITTPPPTVDSANQTMSDHVPLFSSEATSLISDPHTTTATGMDPFAYSEYVQAIWPHPTLGAVAQNSVYMHIYSAVRKTGLPNYLSAKVPLSSALNCDQWDSLLEDYDDQEITQFLRFGWPSSYNAPTPPTLAARNHPSALTHATEIDRFLQKEVSLQAMLGPFSQPPFVPWTQLSPLMTVPKKDSAKRRDIIDLSFPKGASVNKAWPKTYSKDVVFLIHSPPHQTYRP